MKYTPDNSLVLVGSRNRLECDSPTN